MNYRQAVIDFCLHCKNGDAWAVGNCAQTDCKLYSVRPNKVLFGQKRESSEQFAEQDVLDQLSFTGLKTMLMK